MDSLVKFKWSFCSVSLYVCSLDFHNDTNIFLLFFLLFRLFLLYFFTIIRIVFLIYVPQHHWFSVQHWHEYVCVLCVTWALQIDTHVSFCSCRFGIGAIKRNAKHQTHKRSTSHWFTCTHAQSHANNVHAFHSLVINKYNYSHSEYMQTIGNNRQVPPIHCSFAITLWNCACYCNPCSKQASSASPAKRTSEYTHINEWEKNSSSKNSIHNGKTEDSRSTGEERSGVCVVSILTSIHLKVF